jgi:hypothetical protein
MEFPRQTTGFGGWTILPEYLGRIQNEIKSNTDLPDSVPSWEQIEMVLLAAEKVKPNE